MKTGAAHVSRAGFTDSSLPIEIEADHFASGLLLPTSLVRLQLDRGAIGLEGVEELEEVSKCSLTACAIRAAECSPYPMAIVVSRGAEVRYAFISDGFKKLGRLGFLQKGSPLPPTLTRRFNSDDRNVASGKRGCDATTLRVWFGGDRHLELDEQVVGLGAYGFTLTILSTETPPPDRDEEIDEEAEMIESYTLKFAHGR